MEIHGKDLQTVESALRIAAEQYRRDANAEMVYGLARTASQFRSQADACERLIMRIADEGEDD